LLGESVDVAEWAKDHSKELLESARKELEKEYVTIRKDTYKSEEKAKAQGLLDNYKKGKQDALKDFPKWKKAKESRYLPDGVVKIDKDGKIIHSDVVWEEEYFIILQSLESLQKEEL
jgi:hypothetical protein